MLLTEQEFYNKEIELGISGKNPAFVQLVKKTFDQLTFEYKTVLDYGAGMGVYSDEAHRRGFEVSVWEKFKIHKEHIKGNYPYLKIVSKPITTDLMLFIEVAEHMTDAELNKLFDTISPRYILFSSTSNKTDKDIEWGHINVKTQENWIAFFQSKSYSLTSLLPSPPLPTPWAKLFIKNI